MLLLLLGSLEALVNWSIIGFGRTAIVTYGMV